jgi:hypothetical protein
MKLRQKNPILIQVEMVVLKNPPHGLQENKTLSCVNMLPVVFANTMLLHVVLELTICQYFVLEFRTWRCYVLFLK